MQIVANAVGVAQADLQVTQSATTTRPTAGAPLTYTLQVKNARPDTATAVMVTDTMLLEGAFVGAVGSPGGPCSVADQVITCALGDIPRGIAATKGVDALAPTTIGGFSVTTATVTSGTFDPNTANNTAAVTISSRYETTNHA